MKVCHIVELKTPKQIDQGIVNAIMPNVTTSLTDMCVFKEILEA